MIRPAKHWTGISVKDNYEYQLNINMYYANEVGIPKELLCLFYKMKYTNIDKMKHCEQ